MALNLSLSPVIPRERRGDGLESFDIVDMLPDDPFGMKVDSTLSAAIAGLIEDLVEEYGSDEWGSDDRCSYLGGHDYYWSASCFSPMGGCSGGGYGDGVAGCPMYLSYEGSRGEILGLDPTAEWWVVDPYEENFSDCNSFVSQSDWFVWVDEKIEEARYVDICPEAEARCAEGSSGVGVDGLPHDGILFALRYLGVRDLLAVEMVCKTLQSAVRNDPSLWRCIHISQPLNDRVTDEALLQLTKRADGNLKCLKLVDCTRITNDGLKRVLETNGRITKLNLHGCKRLTVEGLLNSFEQFNSPDHSGIKHLMISGILASSEEHYEDLISLLDLDITQQSSNRKPRFYHVAHNPPSCEYDRVLDVELCPKCQFWRLLYDCPAESCREKIFDPCRACAICIPRCFQCGRCVTDDAYEETFYLDILCSVCVDHLCKTQEGYEASFGKREPLLPLLPVPSASGTSEEPAAD